MFRYSNRIFIAPEGLIPSEPINAKYGINNNVITVREVPNFIITAQEFAFPSTDYAVRYRNIFFVSWAAPRGWHIIHTKRRGMGHGYALKASVSTPSLTADHSLTPRTIIFWGGKEFPAQTFSQNSKHNKWITTLHQLEMRVFRDA
jgi:hypothetical protein